MACPFSSPDVDPRVLGLDRGKLVVTAGGRVGQFLARRVCAFFSVFCFVAVSVCFRFRVWRGLGWLALVPGL